MPLLPYGGNISDGLFLILGVNNECGIWESGFPAFAREVFKLLCVSLFTLEEMQWKLINIINIVLIL